MRIVGGKYKGHHLVSFQASHIRPTTDRVKESLYNIWQNYIDGARVLDLFSGTGNLGLEALSRGAESVDFVDLNRKSIDILRQNIAKLKITEPHRVIQQDVIKFLAKYEGAPYTLILIDPPFTEEMADEVMQAVSKSKVYDEHTLISIESGRREKIQEDYEPIYRYDVREFGDKFLSLFRMRGD